MILLAWLGWPTVTLVAVVAAFLLGVHVVGAYERARQRGTDAFLKVEEDRIAAGIGQTAQLQETLRHMRHPPDHP